MVSMIISKLNLSPLGELINEIDSLPSQMKILSQV